MPPLSPEKATTAAASGFAMTFRSKKSVRIRSCHAPLILMASILLALRSMPQFSWCAVMLGPFPLEYLVGKIGQVQVARLSPPSPVGGQEG